MSSGGVSGGWGVVGVLFEPVDGSLPHSSPTCNYSRLKAPFCLLLK